MASNGSDVKYFTAEGIKKMEEELDGDTYHCPIPDGCKPRALGMKM